MTTTKRSPVKGLQKLVMWQLISDTEELLEYGPANAFVKSLMTATDTPNVSEGELSADDQTVESDMEVAAGTLAVGVTGINEADRLMIYGNKLVNGTVIQNKDDLGSYVATSYMTTRSDGKVNLYKKLKVRFAPSAETFNTRQVGNISYATTTINGKYIPTIKDGNLGATRYAVDPVADKTIIDSWFTEALYLGPAAGGTPPEGGSGD